MFGIGAGEFVVILIVGLIVFGPGKLPEVGRALGKVLREFRKAQAALSETLNEVDISGKDEVKRSEDQKIIRLEDQKIKSEKPAQSVTADEVINLAKANPIVKENTNEKISNGNSNDVATDAVRAGVTGAGGNSSGTDK